MLLVGKGRVGVGARHWGSETVTHITHEPPRLVLFSADGVHPPTGSLLWLEQLSPYQGL